MAETKKSRGTAAKKTVKKPQKALTEVENNEVDNSIESEEKTAVKRNVVGTGVHSGDENTPTESEKIAELEEEKRRLEEEVEMLRNSKATPSVIQVSANTEKVCFLWQAEVADDCTVSFGGNGRDFGNLTGKTGIIYVPKNEISMFLDTKVRYYIKRRWLIALDGLTEQEMKSLGMDYKEGEILDTVSFENIIELGDEILKIFPKLCNSHKEIVAKRYSEAWQSEEPTEKAKVNRDTVVALNAMCKESSAEIGAFAEIIKQMNEDDLNR